MITAAKETSKKAARNASSAAKKKSVKRSYQTVLGAFYNCKIEDALESKEFELLKGKVNLIFTSPPFPLNRKKKYGNKEGQEYVSWISNLMSKMRVLLAKNGSIVLEIGNAWNPKSPTMSLLPLQTLMGVIEQGDYKLCQQFIWNNTAKLPSPVQWVNIKRCRVKDVFTNIWWISPTTFPKANNKNVLVKYSKSMSSLLKRGEYNSGQRPSEHVIGKASFLKNHSGAIPGNVLSGANTQSQSKYIEYCKNKNIEMHPARMPAFVAEFFIKLLTEEGDIVLDPFAGSNTTGEVAQLLNRKWVSVEVNSVYARGSKGRFT